MRALAVVLGLLLGLASVAEAAGERELARQRYEAGQAKYKAGDFEGAILEFAAADALAPSPILSYNIAVCHEQLGNSDAAVRRYREYLTRRPDAGNRGEIEKRIAELDAREPPIEDPPPATVPTRPPASDDGLAEPRSVDEPAPERPHYDPAFARRLPGRRAEAPHAPAPEAERQAPAPAPERQGPPPPPPEAAEPMPAAPPPPLPPAPSAPVPDPPRAKPFYKQWWFWVFVGIGAVIVIDAAASGSDRDDAPAIRPMGPHVGGATILKF